MLKCLKLDWITNPAYRVTIASLTILVMTSPLTQELIVLKWRELTSGHITGLANLASVCETEITGALNGTIYRRDKSTLVAWDHGFYGNPFTAAHELGHM